MDARWFTLTRLPWILLLLVALATFMIAGSANAGPPEKAGPPDHAPSKTAPSHAAIPSHANAAPSTRDTVSAAEQAPPEPSTGESYHEDQEPPERSHAAATALQDQNVSAPDATDEQTPRPTSQVHDKEDGGSPDAPSAPLAPWTPEDPTEQAAPAAIEPAAEKTPTPPLGLDASWIAPATLLVSIGAIATVAIRTRPASKGSRQPRQPIPSSASGSDDASHQEQPSSARVEPGIEGVLLLAQDALDEGKTEDAIRWFETAIAIKSDLQAAHFCLGLCLDEADRLDEARDALGNAHKLAPRDPLTRYAYASALARHGDTENALQHAAYLAEHHPALADTMLEDHEFASLHDHPRLLAVLGEL